MTDGSKRKKILSVGPGIYNLRLLKMIDRKWGYYQAYDDPQQGTYE